jgi:uncharacterized protein YggE
MKNTFKYFIIIGTCVIIASTNAQDFPTSVSPRIEVTGTANVKVVPDLMKWSLTVKADDDDVRSAKTKVDNSVEEILQILKDKNIDFKDIQTGGIKIMKNYDYYGKKLKEFSVSNDIWFTLNDISRYEEFASALILVENVFINNTMLDYSKAIETRQQARTDALLAAKLKAEQMADVLGEAIGKPLLIQEASMTYYPNPFNSSTYESTYQNYSSSSTFSEGTIDISARVRVIFELINK